MNGASRVNTQLPFEQTKATATASPDAYFIYAATRSRVCIGCPVRVAVYESQLRRAGAVKQQTCNRVLAYLVQSASLASSDGKQQLN